MEEMTVLRNRLTKLYLKEGLTKRVIKLSEELDKIILAHQKEILKNG